VIPRLKRNNPVVEADAPQRRAQDLWPAPNRPTVAAHDRPADEEPALLEDRQRIHDNVHQDHQRPGGAARTQPRACPNAQRARQYEA
jgi:hypothetical protein